MEFSILGPLDVRERGVRLPLGGKKQRAVLAALLLHANRVVPTSRLAEELWGDPAPDRAAKLIQGYVHAIRRALPGVALVTEPPGYLLRAEQHEVDLLRFEELVEGARDASPQKAAELLRDALGLWRGAALADVEFHGQAAHERERLDELRQAAVEARIDADLALGRHASLVAELRSLVREHPLRERLRGQLMLALYRSGRQAEALDAYREARRTLVAELGIEPGPSLQRLEQAILRQAPELELEAEPGDAAQLVRTAPTTPEDDEARTPARSDSGDEIRPVTVLFADVVGSTSLGERLRPEEVKALIGECVSQMSRAVEEFGGTVQAYQGDGICAYFGVPAAHEDDAERAARAGLRILEIVGAYARDIAGAWGIADFDVRVGINSGQTAVGLVGGAEPQAVALGDATNVAARLQALAAPGTVVVGERTARLLAHRFALEPLADAHVKGRAAPVAAARLVGTGTAVAVEAPPVLVDREAEVGRLVGVVDELLAGRGQVLLISGDAGIGKTRLLAELRNRCGDRVTWLEGHCVSYGGLHSWPFAEALRGWLGLTDGEAPVAVRTKARAKLGLLLAEGVDGVLEPLGRLLGVSLDASVASAGEAPPSTDALRRAYASWVRALSEERPVVLAIEDFHWADEWTREFADALLPLTDRAPLLFVTTLTQDRAGQGWPFRLRVIAEYAHRAQELALGPLPEEAARALVDAFAGGALDDAARTSLLARAEGNPLFLEELLRSVADAPTRSSGRTWTVSVRAAALPPALESVLVARIDRLPNGARVLAQTAAVIGRTFPVRVLARVAQEDDLQSELETLLRAEIVREVRRYPELECAFTHGLVQEAALSTLTSVRRRELYGRVAAAFEEIFADSLDEHLERIAHYHAQSEDSAGALAYLERAAARAEELGAPPRARALWSGALTLAAELGDEAAERRSSARAAALA